MNPSQQRRVTRRMLHRSRSATVIGALVVVSIGLVWLTTEAVLALLGQAPLWLAPDRVVTVLNDTVLNDAPTSGDVRVSIAAAVLAIIGVALLIVAFAPGRRARRRLVDERTVIVVDDAVLAGALSRAAASAAQVPAGQVRTALSRRHARIQVTPTSGFDVPTDAVDTAIGRILDSASPTRAISRTVTVSPSGVLA